MLIYLRALTSIHVHKQIERRFSRRLFGLFIRLDHGSFYKVRIYLMALGINKASYTAPHSI